MPAARNAPRRNNAPIRTRRPATTVPDFLIACAGGTFTMAAALAAVTVLPGENVINDDTGRALARTFAGLLTVSSFFLALMAFLLLRGERTDGSHYWTPLFLGAIAGVLMAWFFLAGWTNLLWAPPVLLLFSFRPIRRIVSSVLGRGGRQ
jgi:hypothetical protein